MIGIGADTHKQVAHGRRRRRGDRTGEGRSDGARQAAVLCWWPVRAACRRERGKSDVIAWGKKAFGLMLFRSALREGHAADRAARGYASDWWVAWCGSRDPGGDRLDRSGAGVAIFERSLAHPGQSARSRCGRSARGAGCAAAAPCSRITRRTRLRFGDTAGRPGPSRSRASAAR